MHDMSKDFSERECNYTETNEGKPESYSSRSRGAFQFFIFLAKVDLIKLGWFNADVIVDVFSIFVREL